MQALLSLLLVAGAAAPEPVALSGPITEVIAGGDVSVTIEVGKADRAERRGHLSVDVADGVLTVHGESTHADASVRLVLARLVSVSAHDGARVRVAGFRGKKLHVNASGAAQVTIDGRSVDDLVIDAHGTSRVLTLALPASRAQVTLTDAARARVTATGSLRCDLQRASRLTIEGLTDPERITKKVSGVARLELR